MVVLALLLSCNRAEPQPPSEPAAPVERERYAPASAGSELLLAEPTTLAESSGVTLTEHRWRFRGEDGWAWVARFPRDAPLTIEPSDEVKPLAAFRAPREGEVVINGGFYDDGAMGLVRHEGVDVSPLRPGGGSGIVYGGDTPIDVVHRDSWTGQGSEALQSIDRLVHDGESLVKAREDAPSAARAAVAVREDAVLLVVAASSDETVQKGPGQRDLRAAEDEGLPLWTFADLLVALGAERALNMDGGISVELRRRVDERNFVITGGPGTINAVRVAAP